MLLLVVVFEQILVVVKGCWYAVDGNWMIGRPPCWC